MSLIDTNVLIALLWPAHEAHTRCSGWFRSHAQAGWATCPMTQTGFVRIVSSPAFSRDAPRADQALALLFRNLDHPAHQFWPDHLPLSDAVGPARGRLFGHKQITDAYLLGLAVRRQGRLVTMDGGIRELLPPDHSLDEHLLKIS